MDEVKRDIARNEAAAAGFTNIEYRVVDVMQPPPDDEQFDLSMCGSCSPTSPNHHWR
jgi:hypothetical protein